MATALFARSVVRTTAQQALRLSAVRGVGAIRLSSHFTAGKKRYVEVEIGSLSHRSFCVEDSSKFLSCQCDTVCSQCKLTQSSFPRFLVVSFFAVCAN